MLCHRVLVVPAFPIGDDTVGITLPVRDPAPDDSEIRKPHHVTGASTNAARPVSCSEICFSSAGETIAATWYRPDMLAAALPCVVMGHGFTLTRRDGIPEYARRLAAAGFAALAFDYRHWGDSTGQCDEAVLNFGPPPRPPRPRRVRASVGRSTTGRSQVVSVPSADGIAGVSVAKAECNIQSGRPVGAESSGRRLAPCGELRRSFLDPLLVSDRVPPRRASLTRSANSPGHLQLPQHGENPIAIRVDPVGKF